jgi:hypothetical protein
MCKTDSLSSSHVSRRSKFDRANESVLLLLDVEAGASEATVIAMRPAAAVSSEEEAVVAVAAGIIDSTYANEMRRCLLRADSRLPLSTMHRMDGVSIELMDLGFDSMLVALQCFRLSFISTFDFPPYLCSPAISSLSRRKIHTDYVKSMPIVRKK